MKILNVAEKPSVAKSISKVLSNKIHSFRGKNKFCPNYTFEYDGDSMVFTSVLGHLFNYEFARKTKWNEVDPFELFTCPIESKIKEEFLSIKDNIISQSQNCSMVIIWTDCDREGEHIANQIKKVLLMKYSRNEATGNKYQSSNQFVIKRARFSGISRTEIVGALDNLIDINYNESDAVDARIELDLRLGSAFTRLQTLSYSNIKDVEAMSADKNIISFGPCQIPTLNFVVQRHNEIIKFQSERFYSINITVKSITTTKECKNNKSGSTSLDIFKWSRGDVFDKNCVLHFYNLIRYEDIVVTNKSVTNRTKYKPLPLRTVEFQKIVSGYYKMSGKKIMDIAEKLYNLGYISYPRTETDSFGNSFGYTSIINKLQNDTKFAEYAEKLIFCYPRNGLNNDQAHSPIYPLRDGNGLEGDERKIFDFIARRFLGCISDNAKGVETEITLQTSHSTDIDGNNRVNGEMFTAKGLIITHRNYLDIYIYDKWDSKSISSYEIGETIQNIKSLSRNSIPNGHIGCASPISGNTSKPDYLSESDLITLMDKNGIGTDATIHEHIQKIQLRNYVKKENNRLIPFPLGINLIEGYNNLRLPISEPNLRKDLEIDLVKICEGKMKRNDLVKREIEVFQRIYKKMETNIAQFVEILKQNPTNVYINDHNASGNSHTRKSQHDDSSGGDDLNHDNETNTKRIKTTSKDISHNNIENRSNNTSGQIFTNTNSNNTKKHHPQFSMNSYKSVIKTSTIKSNKITSPKCICNKPAKRLQTKKGPNINKYFYCCKYFPKKCEYFQWEMTEEKKQ